MFSSFVCKVFHKKRSPSHAGALCPPCPLSAGWAPTATLPWGEGHRGERKGEKKPNKELKMARLCASYEEFVQIHSLSTSFVEISRTFNDKQPQNQGGFSAASSPKRSQQDAFVTSRDEAARWCAMLAAARLAGSGSNPTASFTAHPEMKALRGQKGWRCPPSFIR